MLYATSKTLAPQGEGRFSDEHRERFERLLKIGEVYAINLQPEDLPFGPWTIGCDLLDDDTADRLMARFCAAVRKAAITAGAPPRTNLLDTWISRLAKKNRLGLDCLIQRSIELGEEFESASAELPRKMRVWAATTGLRRDRYPTNFEVPYWLYDVPHDTLADPESEFVYWKDHVWQGCRKLLQELEKNGVPWTDGSIHDARKRQPGETRRGFRDRIAARVSTRYKRLQSALQCLGFDLAVLLANYVIDCGLTGSDAMQVFGVDSVQLTEEMNACWKDISRRLGLSLRKQLQEGTEGFDIAKPFGFVKDDLALLVAPARTGLELSIPEAGAETGATVQSQNSRTPKKPVRRNKKYNQIDDALKEIAESRPRTQEEVFNSLSDRHINIPMAKPFETTGGWTLGMFRK